MGIGPSTVLYQETSQMILALDAGALVTGLMNAKVSRLTGEEDIELSSLPEF